MKVNVFHLQLLVNEKFKGNRTAFSKAIGVKRSHVSKVLNTANGAGALFLIGLLSYCEREKLDYKDYISLM